MTHSQTAIDVWTVALAQPDSIPPQLRQLLSDDECARADRLVFDRDRNHFICCRAALRTLLGNRLGMRPSELRFAYGPRGKPTLPDVPLEFNVSHSGEFAVIGIGGFAPIGIDIEKIRDATRNDWSDLARRFFSTTEVDALSRLPTDKRTQGFFACWSRKEAYIKLHGLGLALPLGDFSVSVDPDENAALLDSKWRPTDLKEISLHDLDAPSGYRACLALAQSGEAKIMQTEFMFQMDIDESLVARRRRP